MGLSIDDDGYYHVRVTYQGQRELDGLHRQRRVGSRHGRRVASTWPPSSPSPERPNVACRGSTYSRTGIIPVSGVREVHSPHDTWCHRLAGVGVAAQRPLPRVVACRTRGLGPETTSLPPTQLARSLSTSLPVLHPETTTQPSHRGLALKAT